MPAEAKDLELLVAVLDRDDLPDGTREAFEDMQHKVDRYGLSSKQRAWARAILAGEKYEPEEECLNLWSSGKVPKGRDVPTPAVLLNLPKKPPPRPKPADDEEDADGQASDD
jgi:hypothetical protein